MSEFYSAQVTVAGPGQTFDDVIILIQRTLQSAGYVVEIENEYPYKAEDEDKILAHMQRVSRRPYPIKLTAKHCPWGG